MKIKKIKKYLSLIHAKKYDFNAPFFIIESGKKVDTFGRPSSSKVLTKQNSRNINLSKFLPVDSLKYPLVISFFNSSEAFNDYVVNVLKQEQEKRIVFTSSKYIETKTKDIVLRKRCLIQHTFPRLKGVLRSHILLARCLRAAAFL